MCIRDSAYCERYISGGIDTIFDEYCANSVIIGKEIKVLSGNETVTGVCRGFSKDVYKRQVVDSATVKLTMTKPGVEALYFMSFPVMKDVYKRQRRYPCSRMRLGVSA